jgi:glycerol uptake facilitator-like aquaporin
MSKGDVLFGEMIGTAILMLFGAAVAAAVLDHMAGTTIPEIRNPIADPITEILAAIALVLPVLALVGDNRHVEVIGIGQLPGAEGTYGSGITTLLVSLLVVGIGLSLAGATGCAITPARDLGPRIVRAFLPIPDNRARLPADPEQGHLRLGLLVDPSRRTAGRRSARCAHLQRSLLTQPKG